MNRRGEVFGGARRATKANSSGLPRGTEGVNVGGRACVLVHVERAERESGLMADIWHQVAPVWVLQRRTPSRLMIERRYCLWKSAHFADPNPSSPHSPKPPGLPLPQASPLVVQARRASSSSTVASKCANLFSKVLRGRIYRRVLRRWAKTNKRLFLLNSVNWPQWWGEVESCGWGEERRELAAGRLGSLQMFTTPVKPGPWPEPSRRCVKTEHTSHFHGQVWIKYKNKIK